MLVFFLKNDETIYPKGRALMQMYRVSLKRKEGIHPCILYDRNSYTSA